MSIEKGDTVRYKGEQYILRDINSSGFAQLTDLDGKNFPGTPLPNKLKLVKKATIKEEPKDPPLKFSEGFVPNEGQLKAIKDTIEFIRSKDRFAHTISGAAGTGKTSVLNQILDNLPKVKLYRDFEGNPQVVITAPTHKALMNARMITGREGRTLQSLLGLRPDMDMEVFSKNDMRFIKQEGSTIPFNGVIVVDEASMINNELYETLVSEAKAKESKVLFIGDELQLKPVGEDEISKVFTSKDASMNVLSEVMRQKGDNPLLDTLDNIRKHIDTNTSILGIISTVKNNNGDGIEVTNNRRKMLNEAIDIFSSDEYKSDKDNYKILAFKNITVANYNYQIRKDLGLSGHPKVGEVLTAYNTVMDSYGISIANSVAYEVVRIEESIERTILGVPIIGNNISIKEISKEKFSHNTSRFLMDSELTSKENKLLLAEKLIALAREIRNSGNKSRWAIEYYPVKDSFITMEELRSDGVFAKEKTLDFGYAQTIHKSQGSTYKKVLVDGTDVGSAPGSNKDKNRLLYVALSRPSHNASIFIA